MSATQGSGTRGARRAGARRRAAALVVVAALGLSIVETASPASSASPRPTVVAAARATRCPSSAPKTRRITGRVHTCGQRLIDAAGHEVRMFALQEDSMGWGAPSYTPLKCGRWQHVPEATFDGIGHWGLNSVELFVSWANLEPRRPTLVGGKLVHHWNGTYLRALDRAIARFRNHGIAVTLYMLQSRWSSHFRNLQFPDGSAQPCGTGMPGWLYQGWPTGLRAVVTAERQFFANRNNIQHRFAIVWQMLARRYLGNPAVTGAGILFEDYDLVADPDFPGDATPADLDLAGFYERIGAAIHHVNPRLLLVLPDFLTHSNSRPTLLRRPRVTNAVYSFEYYATNWFPDGRNRLTDYHERAAHLGMPAWISEWTVYGYTRGDPAPKWKSKTLSLLKYAKYHHVGWSVSAHADDMTTTLVNVLKQGF